MMQFTVIGITDNPNPWFPPEVLEKIQQGRVFSGGKRHHEIVAPLLPEGAEWIDITVPLEGVFEKYKRPTPPVGHPSREGGEAGAEMVSGKNSLPLRGDLEGSSIIVFASGDPLFFGFANTIKRMMPDAEIQLFPTFNSLQLLAHRLLIPYHDMKIVSLTGRPWQEFDRALIERKEMIGVLTDKEHNPAAIARRMLEYGYTYYNIYVGEHLGNPELEKISILTLEKASQCDFGHPNCLIIRKQIAEYKKPFGIPDSEFFLLDGREKMITKMPIRLLTLQALDMTHRRVFWDIGACTGSISIEARLLFPHLHIEAFEIRPECEAIIHKNARKFKTPGINVHMGDFLEADITDLPRPEAVFIGGHGGRLKEIMAKVLTVLTDDGIIVMNSVKAPKVITDSHQLWDEACQELGMKQEPPTKILLNENHPIEILRCRR